MIYMGGAMEDDHINNEDLYLSRQCVFVTEKVIWNISAYSVSISQELPWMLRIVRDQQWITSDDTVCSNKDRRKSKIIINHSLKILCPSTCHVCCSYYTCRAIIIWWGTTI